MYDSNEIEIILPDDFHHHFRDGDVLNNTVSHAMKRFGKCIAMPNTVPPIRNKQEAHEYFLRITQAYIEEKRKKEQETNEYFFKCCKYDFCIEFNDNMDSMEEYNNKIYNFQPLMTLYLTDNTTRQDIIDAGIYGIKACKLYPSGATTNSDYGVTDIKNIECVLDEMSKNGILLLIHCEVTDKKYDIFDREEYGIDNIVIPIIDKFPNLKIVMEHITTKKSVDFVKSCGPNIAATITAHHLLYNRNDLLVGGIHPHLYCLPILKKEEDRLSLIEAATSGNPKFFLGTDSAPHSIENKESSCGCAGIFTGHAAIELYAEIFDNVGKLDKLESFSSIYGSKFYGLPINKQRIKLKKSLDGIKIPEYYIFGNSYVKPLRGGDTIKWYIDKVSYSN